MDYIKGIDETVESIKRKLKEKLTEKRYIHSVNVMEVAVKLADKYNADRDKAAVAGILHDCARCMKYEDAVNLSKSYNVLVDEETIKQIELLHGPLGEAIARNEYGIDDKEILSAIRYHTTGHGNMTLLEKIIYIADYIEPARNFECVEEARKLAFEDIDRAVLFSLDNTIRYLLLKGALIHGYTIEARNSIINIIREKMHK